MDINRLCRGCFRELPAAGSVCPHCGFDIRRYESERLPEMLPPDTILRGTYLVGRALGKGGFGITYLGYHLNLSSVVAIKEYYPAGIALRDTQRNSSYQGTAVSLSGSDMKASYMKSMQSFMEEARLLARLKLPGVVEVHDCFQENNTAYIVMEYIDGKSLRALQKERNRAFTEQETLDLLHPVITSLQRLHEEGVIHRDISPDNLMLNSKGGVTLVDFGAARKVSAQNEQGGRSLTVILKPGYAPIEQYHNSQLRQGPWTDVYALCGTMYRLMTNQTPPDPAVRLDKNDNDASLRETLKKNGVSERTIRVVLKGMQIQQKNRYQTMRELENALYPGGKGLTGSGRDDFSGGPAKIDRSGPRSGSSGGASHSGNMAEPSPQGKSKAPLIAVVIAAVMMAGLIGGFVFNQSRKDKHPETETVRRDQDENNPGSSGSSGSGGTSTEDQRESQEESQRESQEASEAESQEESQRESREASEAESQRESQEASEQAVREESQRESQEASEAESQEESQRESQEASEAAAKENGAAETQVSETVLVTGSEINKMLKELSGTSELEESNYDQLVRAILPSATPAPPGVETRTLSQEGEEAVTAWYNSAKGTIYWYSQAEKLVLNENSRDLFEHFDILEELDLQRFDTSQVVYMSGMFFYCKNLKSVDLSGFDTSNAETMYFMFCNSGLESLDLSSFDTSKVRDFDYMFESMPNLTSLDVSSFNTSAAETMSGMFYDLPLEELDLTSFDTSNVTGMSYMFSFCEELRKLDLSSFDTSAVEDMEGMFYSCKSLEELDLTSFEVSGSTDLEDMFKNCSSLTEVRTGSDRIRAQFETGAAPQETEESPAGGDDEAEDTSSDESSEEARVTGEIYRQDVRVIGVELADYDGSSKLMIPYIQNGLDKTIEKVSIAYTAWDADGEPILFTSSVGFKVYSVVSNFTEFTIGPGESEEEWGATIENSLGVHTFKAIVDSYTTADGETWNNPYSYEWKQIYSGNSITLGYSDGETIRKVQEALNAAGYECGSADGVAGRRTYTAMNQYQAENGLAVTNQIRDDLLEALNIDR